MIKSVLKALDVLEVIARHGGELSTTEIAKLLGHEISTVHNLIRTLASRGYLAQPAGGRAYRLGPALTKLFDGSLLEDDLRRRLRPAAAELAREVNENVVISTIRDGEWRRIVRIEVGHMLTVNLDRVKDPLYSFASGRLLLALAPEAEREAIIAAKGLPGEAWPGVRSRAGLERKLAALRRERFAAVHSAAGASVLAAPLQLPGLDPPLAVAVFLPTVRLTPEREKALREALVAHCEGMSSIVLPLPPGRAALQTTSVGGV